MTNDPDEALTLSEAEYEHLVEELDRPPRVIYPICAAAKRVKRRRSW